MKLDTKEKITRDGRRIIVHTNKCECKHCLLLRVHSKKVIKEINQLLK